MKFLSILSTAKAPILPVAGRDHLQGSVTSPLALVEYGDYECPYCGEAHPVVKTLQRELGDRLCFAFRNFPLNNVHPHAQRAAESAEAAGVQGQFWQMHDLLFENQDHLSEEDIAGYASVLRLDARRLISEILAGQHTARVREDFRSGARGGVNGTPTFFINGARFDGSPTVHGLLNELVRRQEG